MAALHLKMLAKKIVLESLVKKNAPATFVRCSHATGGFHDERLPIGNREWVGYGRNSKPNYNDRLHVPFPAVRFMEIKGDLIALREKEKGDWKKLTIEEKKKLYRASFRQTFAEVTAPTGEWKSILGWTLLFASIGVWAWLLEKKFILRPLPESFSPERRAAQFRKVIDIKAGAVNSFASEWDYEKDTWKK